MTPQHYNATTRLSILSLGPRAALMSLWYCVQVHHSSFSLTSQLGVTIFAHHHREPADSEGQRPPFLPRRALTDSASGSSAPGPCSCCLLTASLERLRLSASSQQDTCPLAALGFKRTDGTLSDIFSKKDTVMHETKNWKPQSRVQRGLAFGRPFPAFSHCPDLTWAA